MLVVECRTFWELEAAEQGLLRARAFTYDGCLSRVLTEQETPFPLVSKLGKWSDEEDEGLWDQSTDAGSHLIDDNSCCASTADASETDGQTLAGPPGFHALAPLSLPPGVHAVSDCRTTLRLVNLPSGMCRDDVVCWLQTQGFSAGVDFDFVFVPMDTAGVSSLGHAIINMCTPHQAEGLLRRLQGFHSWACGSTEVLEIVWNAQEQGLNRLVERLRNSSVMHMRVPDICKPCMFSQMGRVQFPKPTRRIRCQK
jgi:hypothetical protein